MLRLRSNWRVICGVAERTGRGHRIQAGDGGELLFERRRHRRGHRFRAGAGKAGGNLDGGKIDVRQIADGQIAIAENAEEKNGQHDQAGHDRPANENFTEIHGIPASSESLGEIDFGSGNQAHLPVGDHGFADGKPLQDFGLVVRRFARPSLAGHRRSCPASPRKRNLPCCPVCTACDGTTSTFCCSFRRSRTLENWPGQRRWSVFGNGAISSIVPVLASTVLLTKVRTPFSGAESPVGVA